MLTPILIIIAVVIAALLVYAATKPDSFRIARTLGIKADPAKIFPLLNDFHNWLPWSPFEKLDPNLTRTYSGAQSGKGAIYEWDSKTSKVGAGRMEITEVQAPSKIVIKLDFIRPFAGHNTSTFTLDVKDGMTDVTWATEGHQSYISKVMCIFIDMDKMIGTTFAAGLNDLKGLVEGTK